MKTENYEKIYEFLNELNIEFEGKHIYFGTTKDFCRDYGIDEQEYYEEYSKDIIKLPKMRA